MGICNIEEREGGGGGVGGKNQILTVWEGFCKRGLGVHMNFGQGCSST